MSSETKILANAKIVLNSLKSENPFYLGSKFTIETDPSKREQFSKLKSQLNSKDPDFDKTMLALKVIASVQDPSSISLFERINNAVSPLLPMSQAPNPNSLQKDLTSILLALDVAVILLNITCLEELQNGLMGKQNFPEPLVPLGKKFGLLIPPFNSRESFALFLRWANFRQRVKEGDLYHVNSASKNRSHISELFDIKRFSLDPETKELASHIYFCFEMNQIEKKDIEEGDKITKFSKNALQIGKEYLTKYNHSLLEGLSDRKEKANKEQLKDFSNFLSDESVYASYEKKYNELKTLREASKKRMQFTSTYFNFKEGIKSGGSHFNNNGFPPPNELKKWVFENLLTDVVVKTSDSSFVQFLQESCQIDCAPFIVPLTETPPPLPALPVVDSSLSLQAVDSQSSSVPNPSQTVAAFESKQMEASSINAMFRHRTFQKPFPYHERVVKWFDDPAGALSAEEYRNLPQQVQEEIAWKHGFPRLVDSFVGTEYCLEGKWQNKNTLYFIPAEIEKGGRTFRGGFQYAFLPNGTCYHRCWGQKSNDDLMDQLMNQTIWNEVDFPPLEEAVKGPPKPRPETIDSFPVELDPRSGMVTFMDGNAKITLFKIGLEH